MRIEENSGRLEIPQTRRQFLGLVSAGARLVVAEEVVRRSGLRVPSEEPVELASFQMLPEALTDPRYPNLSFLNESAHTDFNNPALNPRLKNLMTGSHHQLLIDCVHNHPKFEKRYHPTDPVKISDHFNWNAIDIGEVDGEFVRPDSEKARAYVLALKALQAKYKDIYTRLITPFGDLTETNIDHQTHIHIGNTLRNAPLSPHR